MLPLRLHRELKAQGGAARGGAARGGAGQNEAPPGMPPASANSPAWPAGLRYLRFAGQQCMIFYGGDFNAIRRGFC
jgi:hypothetical protein